MWPEDVEFLACPRTRHPLVVADITEQSPDQEIIEGELEAPDGTRYPIRNGIPRFTAGAEHNATWDYKWTELDGGEGLNYRIIDRSDPAYEIHDLFDRNGYDGAAHRTARGGVALDLGCGVGQYGVRLLQEHGPRKLVSLDLTRGVDLFRQIVAERYPELRRRILMVQGDILAPPLPPAAFDYVMSLGVLMHTGDTRRALRKAAQLVAPGGHLNVWIYAAGSIANEAREPGREGVQTLGPLSMLRPLALTTLSRSWIRLFRRLGQERATRILRVMSGDRWYRLSTTLRIPIVRVLPWIVFPTVHHPDYRYRLINNFDGYVNEWSDSWGEHELLPILLEEGIALRGLADWRVGIWGVKQPALTPSSDPATP